MTCCELRVLKSPLIVWLREHEGLSRLMRKISRQPEGTLADERKTCRNTVHTSHERRYRRQ